MHMENPYADMLTIMREQGARDNPPTIQVATVVSPPPGIAIVLGELQVDKDNILIADYLLPNYQRKITIPETTATGSVIVNTPPPEPHVHNISKVGIPSGEIKLTDTLKAGDKVAVMATSDRQTYIVLAKVVSC